MQQMRDKAIGTEGTFLSLLNSLDGAENLSEVERFLASFIVYLTRSLESKRIDDNVNVLSRGKIMEMMLRSLKDAKVTPVEVRDATVVCEKCNGACVVNEITAEGIVVTCTACEHTFTTPFE
jgi:hypothetical protein